MTNDDLRRLIKTPKKEYTEGLLNHLLISEEDLTNTEKEIIDYSFSVLKERLEDIKLLNDEVKRLNIELLNLNSYNKNE